MSREERGNEEKELEQGGEYEERLREKKIKCVEKREEMKKRN